MLFFPLIALVLAAIFYLIVRVVTTGRLRPLFVATLGWLAIAGGSALVALLTVGLVELSSTHAIAAHDERDDPAATPDISEPATGEPAATSEAVSIAPAATTAPATLPEIKIDPSAAIPLTPADEVKPEDVKPEDIKIETLPDGTIIIPAGRPQWVSARKADFSDPKVHRIYVTSDPHALPQDARKALDEALAKATDEYISDQLHSPLAARFIHYDVQTIHDRFVKQTYRELLTFADPVGPMHQFHAQLEFDESFRNEISRTWAGQIAESRLYQVGLGAGAALLLLSSVFGYFRLDNATRGYYTGRLQFLTAAAILAVVALGAAAAFQFTWL